MSCEPKCGGCDGLKWFFYTWVAKTQKSLSKGFKMALNAMLDILFVIACLLSLLPVGLFLIIDYLGGSDE